MTEALRIYDAWNRCDECGRFIPLADFDSGAAQRHLLTPDSDRSREEFETLCKKHAIRPSEP